MDERMAKSMDILDRERTVADQTKGSGKSMIFRLLPTEDGKVYDNRMVILLYLPAIACPEIFAKFYDDDQWDFKAAVKGHWINDESGDGLKFVYCDPGTVEYYEKWLGKEFPKEECPFCHKDKGSLRYLMQAFNFAKLIGEQELDEGEERPGIQGLGAPGVVYNQLWNKLKVGNEFWDKKITRITRDNKKGARYAEYMVEVEGFDPEELKDERISSYLNDQSNWVNLS